MISDYILEVHHKKINWDKRQSYHARLQRYEPARVNSTVPTKLISFYGVIAEVYKDIGDRVGENIRIICDMDNGQIVLDEGLPNVISSKDPSKTNPFTDFNPLIFLSQYAGERDRVDGNTVNVFNKDRDFSDPNAGAGV